MPDPSFVTALQHLQQAESRWLPEFRLEYTVHSGLRHGQAYEYEQKLLVKGTGEIQLFRRRSPGDTSDQPPGLYQGGLSREDLLALVQHLEKAPLDAVPLDVPSPMDPVFTLACTAVRKFFSFRWSPPAPPIPEALSGLFNLLNDWIGGGCPDPIWSLRLTAVSTRLEAGEIEAVLRLENRGSESVTVVHPLSPGPVEDKQLSLLHGVKPPEEPGYTPLPMEVEKDILEARPLNDVELVPLPPGRPLEFTVRSPITATEGGGRIGVFGYACYLFPDGAAGSPVFCGSVFSDEVPL